MLEQWADLPFDRAVVPHVDDLGSSHGANRAFLELAARGLVTCGSVMVPGPWFREIAEASCADPTLDIGVHLTLTSEWDACRWAPISTVSQPSGLIDPDGYFWRDLQSVRRHLVRGGRDRAAGGVSRNWGDEDGSDMTGRVVAGWGIADGMGVAVGRYGSW